MRGTAATRAVSCHLLLTINAVRSSHSPWEPSRSSVCQKLLPDLRCLPASASQGHARNTVSAPVHALPSQPPSRGRPPPLLPPSLPPTSGAHRPARSRPPPAPRRRKRRPTTRAACRQRGRAPTHVLQTPPRRARSHRPRVNPVSTYCNPREVTHRHLDVGEALKLVPGAQLVAERVTLVRSGAVNVSGKVAATYVDPAVRRAAPRALPRYHGLARGAAGAAPDLLGGDDPPPWTRSRTTLSPARRALR